MRHNNVVGLIRLSNTPLAVKMHSELVLGPHAGKLAIVPPRPGKRIYKKGRYNSHLEMYESKTFIAQRLKTFGQIKLCEEPEVYLLRLYNDSSVL